MGDARGEVGCKNVGSRICSGVDTEPLGVGSNEQQPADGLYEPARIPWLLHERIGDTPRLRGERPGRITAQQDHRKQRVDGAEILREIDSGASRRLDVEESEIERLLEMPGQRGFGVGECFDGKESMCAKGSAQRPLDRRQIVDDDDSRIVNRRNH